MFPIYKRQVEYLFDDTQDADIGDDDDEKRDDQSEGEHVEDVGPVVSHINYQFTEQLHKIQTQF